MNKYSWKCCLQFAAIFLQIYLSAIAEPINENLNQIKNSVSEISTKLADVNQKLETLKSKMKPNAQQPRSLWDWVTGKKIKLNKKIVILFATPKSEKQECENFGQKIKKTFDTEVESIYTGIDQDSPKFDYSKNHLICFYNWNYRFGAFTTLDARAIGADAFGQGFGDFFDERMFFVTNPSQDFKENIESFDKILSDAHTHYEILSAKQHVFWTNQKGWFEELVKKILDADK